VTLASTALTDLDSRVIDRLADGEPVLYFRVAVALR